MSQSNQSPPINNNKLMSASYKKSPSDITNNMKKPEQTTINSQHRNGHRRSSLRRGSIKNDFNNLSYKSLGDETTGSIPDVKISNIIGDFGPYQVSVVIFAALRAMCCAMDGLSGPFVAPNVKNYQCEICDVSTSTKYSPYVNSTDSSCSVYFGTNVRERYDLDNSRCYFTNAESLRQDKIECNRWTFNHTDNVKIMNSLTIEQSLVCDREWLKSLTNSMYFVGATFGLLFWGIISDRYGRKTAYVCSHFVSLIFGFWALFADTMWAFIILRSINAFGMIGELIPRSIQVEIVATEYRFVCSIICQIGWAFGIILVPALAYFNSSYRFILAFPVIISTLMLPWLIYLPESARWLITDENYPKARKELRRAAAINSRLTDDIDKKIEQFNRQVLREEVTSTSPTTTASGEPIASQQKRLGVGRSILAIFTNVSLLKDTMSVFVLLFVAEVVYFSLTLNVADLGGSLYINYVISGLSELVSIACCAFLLAYLSRRMCLSLLLLLSTISYSLMALVNTYEDSLSMTVILTVNAFGKLTAIANLMVIILVGQEVFPTVIRQFGTSLCITVGKAGSAVAPFTHELGQTIGQSYCFAMFAVICLTCAIIPFGLSETGNRELPDTVNDVEEGGSGANSNKNKRRNKESKTIQYVGSYHDNNMDGSIKDNNYVIDTNELDKQKAFDDNNNNNDSIDNYNDNNLVNKELAGKNHIDLSDFTNPTELVFKNTNQSIRQKIEDENNNNLDDMNYEGKKK